MKRSAILAALQEQRPDLFAGTGGEILENCSTAELRALLEAKWTTAYIDSLPDSAFLYVDADGKRHFPYKDKSGAVDLPHLRNALARIPDSGVPDGVKADLTAKAQRILAKATGKKPSAKEGQAHSWITESVLRTGRFAEAKGVQLSMDEIMNRVSDALRERFATRSSDGCLGYSCWPIQTFDDHVIYRNNGKTWSIEYTLTDTGDVELGADPVEVVQRYQPVTKEAFVEATLGDGRDFMRVEAVVLGPALEADGQAPSGREWDVLLIREGMSKNRNRYGRKVLAEAAPLYEGRPMFIDHKMETGPFGRSGNEVVGFTKAVRPVVLSEQAADGKFTGAHFLALSARAGLVDEGFQKKLVAAYQLGNPDLFGLSHDVRAESVTATADDGPFYDVTAIRKVESTDWVLTPAAGGRVLRLVASDSPHPQLQEDARMLKQLIESLKAAGVTVPENCDEATATRLLNEALKRQPAAATTAATAQPPTSQAAVADQTVEARMAALEASNRTLQESLTAGARAVATLTLERCLLECSLPDPFKARIKKKFEARIAAGQFPTDAEIAEDIKAYVEDVGALREANLVMPHVGVPRVQIVQDRADKMRERLDAFFGIKQEGVDELGRPKFKTIPNAGMTSFREIYVDLTGDSRVTGKVTEDVKRRLSESLNTASFDQILGDSITRKMLKDYADNVNFNSWRGTVAEVVPLNDFRTVRRLRFGGYGNLPTVSQGAPYTSMTSPTDEEATYSPAKRGGTEQITIEMIKNDDVGAIRRIPSKLARAAGQTLYEFVWDMLQNNAAIYDSVALAAAGHNNIVTTALSAANISALRLKLKQQTDMSSGKRLNLVARYLIVPSELEELAFQLTTSDRVLGSNNNDPNFVKKLNLDTIVVEYWTDTNNYWVTASQDQAPMIEVGFLDGQETPELFVQDLPSQGSMFSNDLLTYKLRHIYGGAVMDYRPFAGGIVP
jgi:hypothetical protein